MQLRALLVCVCFAVSFAQELPTLPSDSFTVRIEGNIVNEKYSVEIREVYDYENNRFRFERHADNTSRIDIFFYDQDRHYRVEDGDCEVQIASQSRREPGFDRDNGHLRRSVDLLFLSSNFTYEYQGRSSARGIEVDGWTTDVEFARPNATFNFTLEWYFSVPDWRLRGLDNERQIPVRAVVRGFDLRVPPEGGEPVRRDFFHIYEYVDFVWGTPDDSEFEFPRHVICEDPVPRPLPQLPDSFAVNIEVNDLVRRASYAIREWQDFDSNFVRIDTIRDGVSRVEIFDGNEDEMYVSDGTSCTKQPIPRDVGFYSETTHHVRHTSQQILSNGNVTFEYHYAGQRFSRGINCDVFVTRYAGPFPAGHLEFVDELLFATNWSINGIATNNGPIVSQISVGTFTPELGRTFFFHNIYEYTALEVGSVDGDVFALPAACPGALPQGAGTTGGDGVSPGAVAGIAITLGVVGAIIGAVVQKRLNKNYRPQVDV